MGVHDGVLPSNGTQYHQSGQLSNINDGDLNTRVDTWNGGGTTTHSFVGILWGAPRTDAVLSLTLTLATFVDGGWFGVNGQAPDPGAALTIGHLVEPSVQVLTAEGWTTVAHNSDYLDKFTGHLIGGGDQPNPSSQSATFILNEPQVGISGIRIIGPEGGTASNGFIGVFELQVEARSVNVPEPSLLLLSGLALGALTSRRRR